MENVSPTNSVLRTPRTNNLSLSRALLDDILDHCRDGYPNEACGIVSGKHGRAERVYRMTNIDPDPERRYLIDAKEQFAVFRAMREEGHELLAIFHSHPSTAAYPSETDVDLAFYPDALYIIVSMAVDPPDVRGFHIDRKERTVAPATVTVGAGRI